MGTCCPLKGIVKDTCLRISLGPLASHWFKVSACCFSGEFAIFRGSRHHERRSCVSWVTPNACYHFCSEFWDLFFFSCLNWMGDFLCASLHKHGQRTTCRVDSLLPLYGVLAEWAFSHRSIWLTLEPSQVWSFFFFQRKSFWDISSNAFSFFSYFFVLSLLFFLSLGSLSVRFINYWVENLFCFFFS